jgi:hypothetical protein
MFIVVINMEHCEIDDLQYEIKQMNEYIELLNKDKILVGDGVGRDIIDEKIIEIERQIELVTIKQIELRQLHDLQSSCIHEFVEDLIDLTPDKSMTIQYCVHCLYNAN